MSDILVLNGPNLNMLGVREPGHYGNDTLVSIVDNLQTEAKEKGLKLDSHQDNAEAGLIEAIHQAHENKTKFIIINPAAFTHTSVAIRDALLAVNIPFVEVHLSNVYKREDFRHKSYFSDIALGVISGLGSDGYSYALNFAINYLKK
jgi:3-dehydroquinate dehydratase-2